MFPTWYSLDIATVGVFFVGLLLTIPINWAIYRLAYDKRSIGPFTPLPEKALPRNWVDVVPFLGWYRLRRESTIHGRGFWIRPFLIQLAFPFFLAWFYRFEVTGGMMPLPVRMGTPEMFSIVHVQVFAHSILVVLMVVATFVDFDEQTIPDWITIPGTLMALLISGCSSSMHLISPVFVLGPEITFVNMHTHSPAAFPPEWIGAWSMWVGLGCYALWCFALADRRLILRRGFAKAAQYFVAGLFRHPTWKLLAAIWLVGSAFIVIAFQVASVESQISLLSSLVGIAVAGGLVWLIRIVASLAIGMEAIGFGDVTLMSMIGAFLGWQAGVLGFFLAPITAVIIVLIRFVMTGNRETPFGPYICAGTLLVMIYWNDIFIGWFAPRLFVLGGLLFWMVPGLLIVLGVVLWLLQIVKAKMGLR
jgi:prepilin signal peptidase PulO-like enzyme (type II secretory pathway)